MFESVRSLRPAWIGFGWFIAVALTSLLVFVLTVIDFIQPQAPTEGVGVAVSLMVGFLVAGFFVGTRVNAAPILHALGMGLLSVVVWLGLNLVVGEDAGDAWDAISRSATGSLLALQVAATIVGTRAGVRFARRAGAAR